MTYQAYTWSLHSVKVPVICHLADKLRAVDESGKSHLLLDANTMLRQLGKWAQEYYQPKYKDAEKLLMILDELKHRITIYYQHTNTPILTIQYDKTTNSNPPPCTTG